MKTIRTIILLSMFLFSIIGINSYVETRVNNVQLLAGNIVGTQSVDPIDTSYHKGDGHNKFFG